MLKLADFELFLLNDGYKLHVCAILWAETAFLMHLALYVLIF